MRKENHRPMRYDCKQRSKFETIRRKWTHEEQDNSAEVHEALYRGLIERVVDWVRVLVVAALADPRCVTARTRRRGAATADELELNICESRYMHGERRFTHVPVRLVEERRR